MTTLIRLATDHDLQEVLTLYAQPSMDNGKVLSLEAAQSVFANFKRYPNYRLFVACEQNQFDQEIVVGSYALLIMHNLAHLGTPSAIVEDVVVRESRQSMGIGQLMMRHAMSMAKEAGCYKLALSSNLKRERAHAFYEALGFQRHGLSFLVEI